MKMPRSAREISTTKVYHVILRGINKQQIFFDEEDYDKFLFILSEEKEKSGFKIHSFCLMGNHIHLLIEEKEHGSLSTVMKRITIRFVYWYNIKYERCGHLFQDRFKSEAVEDKTYFCTVVRYIHQNPQKAGLCKELKEYKYSSYNSFINDDKNSIVDRKTVYAYIPKERFEEFSNMQTADKCLDIPESSIKRVTDESAFYIMKKITKCQNASEFQKLDIKKKEECFTKLHNSGLSLRQISRLTGESLGYIQRRI